MVPETIVTVKSYGLMCGKIIENSVQNNLKKEK